MIDADHMAAALMLAVAAVWLLAAVIMYALKGDEEGSTREGDQ